MNFSKLKLSKRQKFVLSTALLALGIFFSQFFFGFNLLIIGVVLALLTNFFLYLVLRDDIKGSFFYPIFILPFFFTLSFALFSLLVPPRLLSKILITAFFSFGLYSLFLTQNIFAVSATRTISLLRSARIVSFVLTLFVLFFLINITFSLSLPFYITPIGIFIIASVLNFQSLWVYSLEKHTVGEIILYSILLSVCLMELSVILLIWPVTAAIYSIFLTGIFYTFSGLSHAWLEKRLFKGVMWEYIWVCFLSVLVLIVFSRWGI